MALFLSRIFFIFVGIASALFASAESEASGGVDLSSIVVQEPERFDWAKFLVFAVRFSKSYHSEAEALRRFHVYVHESARVAAMNKKRETETRTDCRFGENAFSDVTDDEFNLRYVPPLPPLSGDSVKPCTETHYFQTAGNDTTMATDWTWQNRSVVNKVEDQGECGRCWAFATTGTIEAQWAIKHAELVNLAEQQLIDCDTAPDRPSMCCGESGGAYYTQMALEHVLAQQRGGMVAESDYSYTSKSPSCETAHCRLNTTAKFVARIKDYCAVSGNETELAQWLKLNGPVAVGFNADYIKQYHGGICHPLSRAFCPVPNHEVLLVGFGVCQAGHPDCPHETTPYWIVKNSWGAWGEDGYFRLYRGDNTCGIAESPLTAVAD